MRTTELSDVEPSAQRDAIIALLAILGYWAVVAGVEIYLNGRVTAISVAGLQ